MSRLHARLALEPSKDDIRALAAHLGADADAAAWLEARALGDGNLRQVATLIDAAKTYIGNSTVRRQDLTDVADAMGKLE